MYYSSLMPKLIEIEGSTKVESIIKICEFLEKIGFKSDGFCFTLRNYAIAYQTQIGWTVIKDGSIIAMQLQTVDQILKYIGVELLEETSVDANFHNQVMIDIETMGKNTSAPIISIAAVIFSIIDGKLLIGSSFHEYVSLKSSMMCGGIPDAETILWWMRQSDEARSQFEREKGILLPEALIKLAAFIQPDDCVWGNGPTFDLSILKTAYERNYLPVPWNHQNERCLRTVVALNPSIKENHEFKGTKHNALDDCINQIEYLFQTLVSKQLV